MIIIFFASLKGSFYQMDDLRYKSREALQKFICNAKNLNIVEKTIFANCDNCEEKYQTILYEVIFSIRQGVLLKNIIQTVKEKKFGWMHEAFDKVAFEQKEQDDFTISPFQVEEGVLKCPRCSGCKSFSYAKQTRGADEPMTTFATCVTCKFKWTYSG